MTKGEMRAARKAAARAGNWQVDASGVPLVIVRERTPAGEARHAARMHRWARRYDALNGAPESEDDR